MSPGLDAVAGGRARARLAATLAALLAAALAGFAATALADGSAPGGERIIGGTTAPAGKYPFAVSLQIPGREPPSERLSCGGTLVEAQRVLTAAHCVAQAFPGDTYPVGEMVLGGNQDINDPAAVSVEISDVAEHPRWDPARVRYDAAVLELAAPVAGATTVAPIAPREEALWTAGSQLTAVGWGLGNPDGGKLQEATMGVVADDACAAAYRDFEIRFSAASQVCAQGNLQSVCFGDSGGPLLAYDAGTAAYKQVGIVSWGASLVCSPAYKPEVFARVAAMRDFISDPTPTYRPRNLRRPKISGKARVGNTLRCGGDRWANRPRRISYSWVALTRRRTIFGPLAPRFTLRSKHEGAEVLCAARASSAGGRLEAESRPTRRVRPRAGRPG